MALQPSQGGTGTDTIPTTGQILVANSSGIYLPSNNAQPSVVQAQRFSTTPDQTSTLTQSTPPAFGSFPNPGFQPIFVNPGKTYQEILGFGAAMTDAAAYVFLNYLTPTVLNTTLQELYSASQRNWSTVRIALGACDFNYANANKSYDVMPNATTIDPTLANFSLSVDEQRVIPMLQNILAINPKVKIFASIWTPPAWAQIFGTNGSYPADIYMTYFANYIVTAVQAYKALGIDIYALSWKNEPYYNSMSSDISIKFISQYLGPAFVAANITTKIICGEDSWIYYQGHNKVLSDPIAGPFIDGASFHAYNGVPADQGLVASQNPGKKIYLNEMRNLMIENYATQMSIMAGDVVIGSIRNGANSVTVWNAALDQDGNPNSGTTGRLGVITINNSTGAITRNAAYYALAQFSSFLQEGAVRIDSTTYAVGKGGTNIETVAALNPDGSVVLYVYNPTGSSQSFNIFDARTNTGFPVTLVAGEVATFVWGTAAYATPAGASPSLPSVPSTPTITATGQNGQVSLSWSAPTSTVPLSSYTVLRSSTSGAEVVLLTLSPETTAYVDVTGAGTFYYQLIATNTAGNSATSSEVSATASALAAPNAVTVTATSQTLGVALSWTNNTDRPVDTHAIYRSSTMGSQGTLTATVPGNANSYLDTAGSVGATDYYTIVSTNGAGSATSAQSSGAVNTAPSSPVQDTATYTILGTFPGQSITTPPGLNSFGWTHYVTPGLVFPMLIVAVASSSTALAQRVTYAGIEMTLVPGSTVSSGGTERSIQLYYLLNPPSGLNDVSVTFANATTNVVGNSVSFYYVNQSTPFRTAVTYNQTTGTTASVATTGGTATDLVFAAISARESLTPGSGQTSVFNNNQNNTYAAGSTQAGGTGTITSSFTLSSSDLAALVAVAIRVGTVAITENTYQGQVLDNSHFVDNEIVGGSGTAWTLAKLPIPGSVQLFAEGQLLQPGLNNDYQIINNAITTAQSWASGTLTANYRK